MGDKRDSQRMAQTSKVTLSLFTKIAIHFFCVFFVHYFRAASRFLFFKKKYLPLASRLIHLNFFRMLRRCFSSYRVTQATLYGLHVMFGHVLILIIVSFNVWLLFSVAIGKAIGYFLFKGSPVVEKTTIAIEAATPSPRPGRRDIPFASTASSSYPFSKDYYSRSNSSDT